MSASHRVEFDSDLAGEPAVKLTREELLSVPPQQHGLLKVITALSARPCGRGCSTKFGLPPNSATCPVCIGMPGSLPVMSRRAFELALKAALALNCRIAEFTKWDRKN